MADTSFDDSDAEEPIPQNVNFLGVSHSHNHSRAKTIADVQFEEIDFLKSKIDELESWKDKKATTELESLQIRNDKLSGKLKKYKEQYQIINDEQSKLIQEKDETLTQYNELKEKLQDNENILLLREASLKDHSDQIASLMSANLNLKNKLNSVENELSSTIIENHSLSETNDKLRTSLNEFHLNEEILMENNTKLNAELDQIRNDLMKSKEEYEELNENQVELDVMNKEMEKLNDLKNELTESKLLNSLPSGAKNSTQFAWKYQRSMRESAVGELLSAMDSVTSPSRTISAVGDKVFFGTLGNNQLQNALSQRKYSAPGFSIDLSKSRRTSSFSNRRKSAIDFKGKNRSRISIDFKAFGASNTGGLEKVDSLEATTDNNIEGSPVPSCGTVREHDYGSQDEYEVDDDDYYVDIEHLTRLSLNGFNSNREIEREILKDEFDVYYTNILNKQKNEFKIEQELIENEWKRKYNELKQENDELKTINLMKGLAGYPDNGGNESDESMNSMSSSVSDQKKKKRNKKKKRKKNKKQSQIDKIELKRKELLKRNLLQQVMYGYCGVGNSKKKNECNFWWPCMTNK